MAGVPRVTYVLSASPVVGDIVAVYHDREYAVRMAREAYFGGAYGTLLVAVSNDVPAHTVEIRFLDEYGEDGRVR